MALPIPAKPKEFRPDQPPPGYRKLYVNFAAERKRMQPRLQLVHTNGASGQGSIEASKAWAERRVVNGKATTLPTFQVDRDGDAAQFIDINQAQNACYKVNGWAISYETADTGYKTDPSISAFTEAQLSKLANGFAYCSMLYKIPLEYPATWDGAGSACHTEPFTYPYWTNSNGKICPGSKKKAQVRDIILPHARKIVEAWTATTPTPPPTGGGTYTVVSGDSWWGISQKLGCTMNELLAANPPATSSTVIHPGDKLKIPGSAPTPPPTDWMKIGQEAATPPGDPTLREGVTHSNVTWLQAVLYSMNCLAVGAIDHDPGLQQFGPQSKAGVKYWQGANGITADGVYGPQTAAKMATVRGK